MNFFSVKPISLVSCILLISSLAWAGEPVSPEKEPAVGDLRNKIVQLIQEPELGSHGLQEATATIYFFIDGQQKIQVRIVESASPYLRHFIEKRLQGQRIDLNSVNRFTLYSLEVNFSLQ